MLTQIAIPQEQIEVFCRENRIRRLAVFGSALRDDFRPESDIDLLVEFEPEHKVGLFAMAALELELSVIMGRKVDLRTPAELSRYFRQDVMENAEPLYG